MRLVSGGSSAAVAALPTEEQRRGGAPLSAQLVIGTGVKCEAHYSSQIVFKDAMKQSQPFWHQQNGSHWPDGQATPYDPATAVANTNGYPNQDPVGGGWWKTHMRASLGGVYESGTYNVFFDGAATIEVWGDCPLTTVLNGDPITVTPTNEGLHLKLHGIVTAPTYIHVVPAAFVASYVADPFHPDWVSSAAHYKVFRWMDSCGVSSPLSAWANRTVMASQTQTPKLNRGAIVNPNYASYGGWARYWQDEWGMAIEYMVDFCNKVGADIWLCLPSQCTDDYVTQLCLLVKGRLNPGLKLYLEYVNECWNTNFAGTVWMAIQTNTNAAVQFPWSTFGYTQGAGANEQNQHLAMFYQMWRGSQCMQLARAAFGSEAATRLVRVFGTQTAYGSWAFTQAFSHLGLHVNFDAVAPNFYWGHNESVPWGGSMATWKNYCLWKLGESGVDRAADGTQDVALHYGQSMGDELRIAANTIRQFGKRIIAYENGQHIVPNAGAQLTEWSAVQQDQIMYDVYLHMMRVWFRICGPGDVFCHYVDVGGWSSSGTWGSRTTIADVTSKKYLALKDVALGNVQL